MNLTIHRRQSERGRWRLRGREVGRWGPCWSVLTVANKQMRKQNNFYSSPADGSSAARVWLACSPYQGQLAWSVCCPDWPVAPQWAVWAARPFSRCVCGWARAANLTKVGAKWKITFKNAITITNKDTKSKWQMGQSASLPVHQSVGLAWPGLFARLLQPENRRLKGLGKAAAGMADRN